jgi:hypothetical protein
VNFDESGQNLEKLTQLVGKQLSRPLISSTGEQITMASTLSWNYERYDCTIICKAESFVLPGKCSSYPQESIMNLNSWEVRRDMIPSIHSPHVTTTEYG